MQSNKQFIGAPSGSSVSCASYFYQRSFWSRIGSGVGKFLRYLMNLARRKPALAFPFATDGAENCKKKDDRENRCTSGLKSGFEFSRNICGLARGSQKTTRLF